MEGGVGEGAFNQVEVEIEIASGEDVVEVALGRVFEHFAGTESRAVGCRGRSGVGGFAYVGDVFDVHPSNMYV